MKINKIAYSLALLPVAGALTLIGTPAASGAECSLLSPCASNNSAQALSSLTDVLTNPKVQGNAANLLHPNLLTQSVQKVTSPIDKTIRDVTVPIVKTAKKVADPIIQDPIDKISKAPDHPKRPKGKPSAAPIEDATDGIDQSAEVSQPSEAPASDQLAETGVATSDKLNVVTAMDRSLVTSKVSTGLDFGPAAIHSSEGHPTVIRDSGAWGFGHLDLLDENPLEFIGFVFAYIIALGSTIGFAVKRSTFRNFRNLA